VKAAGYPAEVPFVGREAEAALVAMTMDPLPRTPPGQLIVWGEPGIGKTRLLRESAARARDHGRHVLWVQADPVEARIPYGAVSVSLAQAGREVPAELAGEWQAAQAALDVGAAADAGERMTFGRACSAVTRYLARLTETAPATVVVDDLHLLDQESLSLLDVVLARLSGDLGFACTVRALPYPLTSRAGELLTRLQAGTGCAQIHLEALATAHVSLMLEGLWGGSVGADLAESVTSQAAGNPLFVLEIGRALRDSGAPAPGPRQLDDLPPSRHSAVLQRIYPLPVGTRVFAQAASVLRRLSLDQLGLIGSIAGLDPQQTAAAFDELERSQILVEDGAGQWRFFHPFVADALYEDIGTAERKRVHRLVAAQRMADAGAAGPAEVLELAWHVAQSAETGDRPAIEILTRAATLTRTFAPTTAAAHCRQALALLPAGSPDRFPLLALQARCHIIANRMPDALTAGLESLDGLPPGPQRTRAVTAVVGTLWDLGRDTEALDLADREAATGAASAFLDVQRIALRAALGYSTSCSRSDLDAALADVCMSPGEAVLVYTHAATHAGLTGPVADVPRWLDRALDAGAHAGDSLRKYAISRAIWTLAGSGFVTAARALRPAAPYADAGSGAGVGGPGAYPAGFDIGGLLISWQTGDWDEALAGIAASRRSIAESGNQVIAGELRRCEAEIRAWRGDLREALALASQPPMAGSVAATAWVTSGALRALGDLAGAESVLSASAERPDSAVWHPMVLSRLAEVQLAAGREAAARETLRNLLARCQEADDPRPWAQSAVWRARARVERSAGAAATAADIADAEGLRFEAALARLLHAELDPAETRALQRAHSTFSELGADQARRRSGALLRARDVKVPRRRRRQPGILTDTEASIARMVQLGMRNREIAAALHYSERTVEVYLSRIYTTLGIASRLQLARLLDETGDRASDPAS